MDEQLRVSVIIPVYNVEKTLKRCLDSVMEQTYRNLEVLIIDDGSTDGSKFIYESYANKDRRFKIIKGENRGVAYVRNIGFDLAQGNALFFIDSDDYMDFRIISILAENMFETGADIVIADYVTTSDDCFKAEVKGTYQVFTKQQALGKLVDEEIPNYYWGRLYKKHVFNGVRCPEGHIFEDLYTMHSIFLNADRISVLSDKLYAYYLNDDSLCSKNSYTFKKSCDYYYAVKKRYIDLIKYDEFNPILLKQLVYRYLSLVRRFAIEHKDCNVADYKSLIAVRDDIKKIYLSCECKLMLNCKTKFKFKIAMEHIDQYIALRRMVSQK